MNILFRFAGDITSKLRCWFFLTRSLIKASNISRRLFFSLSLLINAFETLVENFIDSVQAGTVKKKRGKEDVYHADSCCYLLVFLSFLLIIARSFLLKLRGRQSTDVT